MLLQLNTGTDWRPLLRFVRDHFVVILSLSIMAALGLFWAVVEALKTGKDENEVMRLRQRLYQLERNSSAQTSYSADPLVVQRRWVRFGSSATSTDGRCFVLVERVDAAQRAALLTVRVDGLAVEQGHGLRTGESFEAEGKAGTYVVKIWAVEGVQVSLSVALRSRGFERAASGSV